MSKGCCKNEVQKFKLKLDQKLAKAIESKIAFEASDYQDLDTYCIYTALLPEAMEKSIEYYQLPPPLLSTKKNILYCVYRI